MTPKMYLYCLLAGAFGILFHIIAVKLPAVRKRAIAANMPFEPLKYLKDDWLPIAGSALTVIICAFVLDEIAHLSEYIMRYVKWFFIAVGFMGSSFLLSALSRTDKLINKVVDKKTNIADYGEEVAARLNQ